MGNVKGMHKTNLRKLAKYLMSGKLKADFACGCCVSILEKENSKVKDFDR